MQLTSHHYHPSAILVHLEVSHHTAKMLTLVHYLLNAVGNDKAFAAVGGILAGGY